MFWTGSQVDITGGVFGHLLCDYERETRPNIFDYLRRHLDGDWGKLGGSDQRYNDEDVAAGQGALSRYTMPDGETDIYISTEWSRQFTTICLVSEY